MIKISEIPADKTIDDYPADTVFILDDYDEMADDEFWEDISDNE